MRFCQPHWDELRQAIHKVGLDAWVPDSGEKAMAAMASQIEQGTTTIDNFDPLMGAHNAIAINMGEACRNNGDATLALFMIAEPICPLCLGNYMVSIPQSATNHQILADLEGKHLAGPFDEWIETAAQGQLDRWKNLAQ